jgi:hypothetical protein
MSMSTHKDRRRSIAILAAACALVLPNLPLVHYVLYPLELLVTAVHETSHALAALLTGGSVISVEVFADGSGRTLAQGGNGLLISSAGYVGSTLFGCLLLVAAQRPRWHRFILWALALWFGLFTLLARNVIAVSVGLGVLAALWLASRSRVSEGARFFVFDFIAASSCLYAFHDFLALFLVTSGAARGSGPTDAQLIAARFGLPPLLWATGWALLSALAAWMCLRAAWRMTERRSAKPSE